MARVRIVRKKMIVLNEPTCLLLVRTGALEKSAVVAGMESLNQEFIEQLFSTKQSAGGWSGFVFCLFTAKNRLVTLCRICCSERKHISFVYSVHLPVFCCFRHKHQIVKER